MSASPPMVRLSRLAPADPFAQLTGLTSLDDPYLDECWGRVLERASVELLREVHELCGLPGSPPCDIARDVLTWRLGLEQSPWKGSSLLLRAIGDASGHGAARWDRRCAAFEVYDPLPLLTEASAATLPAPAFERHLERLEVATERLLFGPHPGGARARETAAVLRQISTARWRLTPATATPRAAEQRGYGRSGPGAALEAPEASL